MFLKKKFTPKKELQLADSTWSVSKGQYQGKPMLVRINMWAKEIMGHPEFPYRIGIAIPFLSPEDNGLPSKKESHDFNEIEDEIFKLFQKGNEAIVSAIVTTGGMCEFLIYSSGNEIADKIDSLKSKFLNYDFQNYTQEDKKWKGYRMWVK